VSIVDLFWKGGNPEWEGKNISRLLKVGTVVNKIMIFIHSCVFSECYLQ
jgi:hypothetical protein